MKKVRYIIRREYVANVRRKSFVISTILVPLLMAAFFVVPVVFSVIEPAKAYRVDVVDQTGQSGADFAAALSDTLKDGRPKYVVTVVDAPGDGFDAERTAHIGRIQSRDADIVIAIPGTVLGDGKASYITREERNMQRPRSFPEGPDGHRDSTPTRRRGTGLRRVKSLTTGVSLDMQQVTAAGGLEEKSFLQDYGVVFVFVMLLYSSLLSWGMTIAKSIVEEKGSRVIEVLLSAVSPRDLMSANWSASAWRGSRSSGHGRWWARSSRRTRRWERSECWYHLTSPRSCSSYLILFFILGFMLFSSLFMIVGAACSTDQDAQQLQSLITLPMIIPILCLMLLIQNPASPLAVVLSLIPLFTPMIMLARVILLQPPAWQILLSIALVVVSIFLAISFAARIFRVGILMYGSAQPARADALVPAGPHGFAARGRCGRLGGIVGRGVAQPGSAPALGAGGRRFKSSRPDHLFFPRGPQRRREGQQCGPSRVIGSRHGSGAPRRSPLLRENHLSRLHGPVRDQTIEIDAARHRVARSIHAVPRRLVATGGRTPSAIVATRRPDTSKRSTRTGICRAST